MVGWASPGRNHLPCQLLRCHHLHSTCFVLWLETPVTRRVFLLNLLAGRELHRADEGVNEGSNRYG